MGNAIGAAGLLGIADTVNRFVLNGADLGMGGTITNSSFAGASLVIKSGNVGIGTTAPTAQLHLVKADSSALTDILVNPTVKTSGNLLDLQVGGISQFSVNNAGSIHFAKGSVIDWDSTARTYAGRIEGVDTTPGVSGPNEGLDLVFSTKWTGNSALVEKLRINNVGHVSIGSTASNVYNSVFSIAGPAQYTGGQVFNPWGTGGAQVRGLAGLYTDNSDAGTRATAVAWSIAQPTFGSTNAVTITDAATLYIANAPVAGTNITLTRSHALWVAAGDSIFAGNVGIGTTSPGGKLEVSGQYYSTKYTATTTMDWANGNVPATAKWPGGVAPVLTSTASAVDIFTFASDGTNLLNLGFAADVK
ncbi:MAG: hypothetical protein CEN89_640 [Candidatus Berkelbacteria bacterium Licking1014_7]|uniref:Uncharacterized protein n=1 Tax=Candidatus Berkelbacteria bacterium Licking1014_7 TaxID=2017147 RepID=A0A554LI17_9BACT|nr:MAG: hypothetical protein CEN89_640 [Candidatus Berkelbacteria bacterium Licking1014_7]